MEYNNTYHSDWCKLKAIALTHIYIRAMSRAPQHFSRTLKRSFRIYFSLVLVAHSSSPLFFLTPVLTHAPAVPLIVRHPSSDRAANRHIYTGACHPYYTVLMAFTTSHPGWAGSLAAPGVRKASNMAASIWYLPACMTGKCNHDTTPLPH